MELKEFVDLFKQAVNEGHIRIETDVMGADYSYSSDIVTKVYIKEDDEFNMVGEFNGTYSPNNPPSYDGYLE